MNVFVFLFISIYLVVSDQLVSGELSGHGRNVLGQVHAPQVRHPDGHHLDVPGVVRGHFVPLKHPHKNVEKREIVLNRTDFPDNPKVKHEEPKDEAPSPPPIPKLGRRASERKKNENLVDLVLASAERKREGNNLTLDITRDDNPQVTKVCKTRPIKNQEHVYAAQCDYSPDSKAYFVKIVSGNDLVWDAKEEKYKIFYLTVVFKDGHIYLSIRVSKNGRYRLETKHASNVSGKWEMLSEVEYNRQLSGVNTTESVKELVLDIVNPNLEKFDMEYVKLRGVRVLRYRVKEGLEDHITRIVEGGVKTENHSSSSSENTGAAALVAGHGDFASIDEEGEESYIWKAAVEGEYCREAFVYPDNENPRTMLVKTASPNDQPGSFFFLKGEKGWNLSNMEECLKEVEKDKLAKANTGSKLEKQTQH